MKKLLMILLSMILVIGCVGLTACGGSESGSESETTSEDINEETAAPTIFYGGYGYMGDDPVVGAVYEYVATVLPESYDVSKDMVSIPVVKIIDTVENDDGTVDVYGVFQIFNYTVDGDTLMTESGGSYGGKMHLVKDETAQVEAYKVESFEQVGDGSEFDKTAKEIFGDNYDAFMKAYSNDKALEKRRAKTIANYVQATGLEVTQYQVYGWDPVKIPTK